MSDLSQPIERYAELWPGIRRMVAPNPSMMTGPGTNTYLFGTDEIAVLDPGPRLREHIEEICDKAGGPIRWILATHTHPDHSPGVRLLAEKNRRASSGNAGAGRRTSGFEFSTDARARERRQTENR